MTRCHLCGGIIWPFPWTHIAFRTTPNGRITWHAHCKRQIERIIQDEADQWERVARDGGV